MAQAHDGIYDDRYYSSSRDSDDSPILSYRYDTMRARPPSPEGRRSTLTALAKFFLFCMAMIMFCVLLYIPVYNKANDQVSKAPVVGWSVHTNRDTKIYVRPNNVTTIHEPKHICPPHSRNKKNNLFLLIIVCSSTAHFDRRLAIRETWGNYKMYAELSKVYNEIREKYKGYNYTYDLYTELDKVNVSDRNTRDVSSFKHILPELAKALSNLKAKTEVPEKRFEDEAMLPEFDMNKELGEDSDNYDYDYESNVMKIPPKGYEDDPNLDRVLNMLRKDKNFEILDNLVNWDSDDEPDFRLLFLLGQPPNENDTEIQTKIEEEVQTYGDVVQEGFIDSYNNLTLKSIMMLKWVTNKCNESVRYILKTDDDMYINVPALITNLKNRSADHDARRPDSKEYMLIGDLICGARPVSDVSNKWYSPRYMYSGRIYPRYLSGTGYALSAPAAAALYRAALHHDYFHLEDVYITGMCALRANPPIKPRDEPQFSYAPAPPRAACTAHARITTHRMRPLALKHLYDQHSMCALRANPPIKPRDDPQFSYAPAPPRAACTAHARITTHRMPPLALRATVRKLLDRRKVDQCERKRLTQVRRDRMKPKPKKGKKLTKVPLATN